MKTLFRICLFASAFLLPSLAFANLGQVTTLSTSAVSTIVNPGPKCWVIVVQNIGANAVNVTIDGGSTYVDSVTGKTGQDPTTGATGKGYVIPAASNGVPGVLVICQQPGGLKPIRAIMQTGTTTLNIITTDPDSTFPTS